MGLINSVLKLISPHKYSKRVFDQAVAEEVAQFRYRQAKRTRLRPILGSTLGSGDAHLSGGDLQTLRERGREIDRDNLFGASIMDRLEEQVIGEGINLRIQSSNKRFNGAVERLWKEWWDDAPEVRGILGGSDLERMLFRGCKVDGDILVVMLNDGSVQLIEGDRIETPSKLTDDENVINGVKVDGVGKILGYYITQSSDKVKHSKRQYKYYSADRCVFFAERHRSSMTRGISAFVRNMDLFNDIDDFMQASIIQQKIAASHVMFIERNGGLDALDGTETKTDSEGKEYQDQHIEAGIIMYGERGETAKMLGAGQTGQQFSPFITQLLRFAGLMYGLPLEILSLDFSKTNFSSAKASMNVAHKSFKKEHKRIVKGIAKIVRWKVNEWVSQGLLQAPPSSGYVVSATPPKMTSVDPYKETLADIARIESGLTSMREVTASNGQDWREVLRFREEEITEAARIAKKIVSSTGEDWSARDILGSSKQYNPDITDDDDNSNDDTE